MGVSLEEKLNKNGANRGYARFNEIKNNPISEFCTKVVQNCA